MVNKHFLALVGMTLLVVMLVTGCSSAAQAKTGDTVKIHYTGSLADNTVFDSSIGSEPLEIILGQGQVIPGFERAVIGMKVGESKTVTIPVDEAYGPRQDDLIVEVGRDKLSPDINPEVGMQLQGNQGVMTIINVSETTVTLDANHPLAGKDLTFDIELIEIEGSQSDTRESGLTSVPLVEALANGKPTLAEFGSSTCVPCKQMKPILEELAVEYEDKLNVVIVEVYEQKELTRQYGIMAIPTQVFFAANGKEVFRHTGFFAKKDILYELKSMGIE